MIVSHALKVSNYLLDDEVQDVLYGYVFGLFFALNVPMSQVGSGSFAGDNRVEPIRPGGVLILGQDQVGVHSLTYIIVL